MIFFKSVLAGMTVLLVALLVYVLISVLPMLVGWQDTGAGGIGFVTVSIGPAFWIVAILAFAGGYWWQRRRSTR